MFYPAPPSSQPGEAGRSSAPSLSATAPEARISVDDYAFIFGLLLDVRAFCAAWNADGGGGGSGGEAAAPATVGPVLDLRVDAEGSPDAGACRGAALLAFGRRRSATLVLSAVLDADPTHPVAMYMLALGLLDRGQHLRALGVVAKAMLHGAMDPLVLDAFGHIVSSEVAYGSSTQVPLFSSCPSCWSSRDLVLPPLFALFLLSFFCGV